MTNAAIPNPALQVFEFLVGRWKTAGRHPYLPGVSLRGDACFEWIEGGAFLRMRSQTEGAEIPAGIAIIGSDDATREQFMLYFDERGVSRKYDVSVRPDVMTWSRYTPEFAQRFTITSLDGGRRMVAEGEMSKEGAAWEPDLHLEYTRELDKVK